MSLYCVFINNPSIFGRGNPVVNSKIKDRHFLVVWITYSPFTINVYKFTLIQLYFTNGTIETPFITKFSLFIQQYKRAVIWMWESSISLKHVSMTHIRLFCKHYTDYVVSMSLLWESSLLTLHQCSTVSLVPVFTFIWHTYTYREFWFPKTRTIVFPYAIRDTLHTSHS